MPQPPAKGKPYWSILLPVALITSATISRTLAPGGSVARVSALPGDPNFALMLAAAVALLVLARSRPRR